MPCDYKKLPHEGIQTLAPYQPGKTIEALRYEIGITDTIVKLASNENPLGCSPNVVKALHTLHEETIATYPVYQHHHLLSSLSKRLGLDNTMLMFGNGSDSLFLLLQACFALHSGKHIIIPKHGFIAYGIQAKTLNIPIVTTPLLPDWQVDIEAIIESCNEKTALIFLANPNNPTGSFLNWTAIKHLLEHIPATTLLVLDEAYYEFNQQNTIALLAQHPNLVITRTFSKVYGLAGLRIGYLVANSEIVHILQRIQLPFSVSAAALVAANAALNDTPFLQKTLRNNQKGMGEIVRNLEAWDIPHLPSAGNFVSFDCRKDAMSLYQSLLKSGIILRPLHPYGLNHYLRVSVGTPEQNNRFLNALQELYHAQ